MDSPLQQLCQDFGRRLDRLKGTILLGAGDSWRRPVSLIVLSDVYPVAVETAHLAIDARLQALDRQFLLLLIPGLTRKPLRVDRAGQGLQKLYQQPLTSDRWS